MIYLEEIQKEDIPIFTDIAIEAFENDNTVYGNYPPLIDFSQRKLRYLEDAYTFKILDDTTLIGGVMIFEGNRKNYTLGSIFIKPDYQDKGLGQQVMKLIELKFHDAQSWHLDTPYKSFRNHYFYEKLGYIRVAEEQPDIGQDFKVFLYEKVMNQRK